MSLIAFLFLVHLAEYAAGLGLALRNGRQGVPLLLALGVLFLYTLFTPFLLWYRGENAIAGISYGAQLPEALGVYIGGVGFLLAAWAVLPAQQEKAWALRFERHLRPGPVLVLLLSTLALAVWGIYQAGVPLGEWLTFKNSNKYLNLFGKHWETPLVDKALDSLITLSYLLALSLPAAGAGALVPLLALFVLAGFRYRIFLLLGSMLLRAWLGFGRRGRWLLAAAGLGLAVGMAWLTLNRLMLSARLFKKLDHDLTHFDLRLLANETNNSQTFQVVLGYYHAEALPANGLWATSTFVAVRALPARFFPDGEKPLAPLLTHIRAAYDRTEAGSMLRPAVSNLEEYYLGYGMIGVLAGMAVLAWLCRYLASLGPGLMSLGSLFLYQFISRGYLPQQVDLAVFLAMPVAVLYLWQRWKPSAHP